MLRSQEDWLLKQVGIAPVRILVARIGLMGAAEGEVLEDACFSDMSGCSRGARWALAARFVRPKGD